VHSVETEHTGTTDSAGESHIRAPFPPVTLGAERDFRAVMYIGAVPKTPGNVAYVAKQVHTFLTGEDPPDYPKLNAGTLVGLGTEADVKEPISRIAMGLPTAVV
jgi:Protein of unknown function (DUF1479)